ncbi:MAG: heparinase II/III family protein [Alphaproteobacteria bacterium]
MSQSRALGLASPVQTHARRAVVRLGDTLRGAVYGSALYRMSLRGRRPDGLAFRPGDPWPGDAGRGRAFLAGEYRFGDQCITATTGLPWHPAGASPVWLVEAHGFAWLRDFEALGSDEARAAARDAVSDWVGRCGAWHPLVWRPDVLGRRIAAWIGHADFVVHAGDTDLKARTLASLAAQLRHLARVAGDAADAEARMAAIKGLVIGALCLPGNERRLELGIELLEREAAEQALADGGHVARSPSVHFRVFQDLVALRAALRLASRPVPKALQNAIDRMAPMLRFFRHGDGGLALFNDSNEENPAVIDAALELGEADGKEPASAPHSGFERLAAGALLVVADVGAPPASACRHTHAGPLSLEVSVGAERLIVNCGAYAGDRPAWRRAQRATAAHSTVTIDDTDAVDITSAGAVVRGPKRVTCARHEDAGSIWLDAEHDGYRETFGVVHRRRLYLDAAGNDLRGEDRLSGPGGKSFAVRFHLHPAVSASLVDDGAGALLRLGKGGGWRLRVAGAALRIAESVYLGAGGEPRRSEQIVLGGPLKGNKTTIKWALSRIGEGG